MMPTKTKPASKSDLSDLVWLLESEHDRVEQMKFSYTTGDARERMESAAVFLASALDLVVAANARLATGRKP